jgi:hypothetical protein
VAAEPHESWLLWVDTDYEQNAVAKLIPNALDIRGGMTPEQKETGLLAFIDGGRPLLTKGKIAGQGLNYQHCARQAFVGRSFSYEQWYQMIRRSWRFGQKRPVDVHLIVAEGEDQIGRVIDRKAEGHAEMKAAMRAATRRNFGTEHKTRIPYDPIHEGRLPTWLSAA